MSDATQAAAVKPAAPGNRNVLLIALVATNMLGMLGLGGYLVLSNRAGAQAPDETAAHAHEHEAPEEMGPLVEFESIVVNLRDSGTDHYLKLTAQVELASEDAAPLAEAHMTPFRDAVLMYLTSLTLSDVQGPDGARAVREHMIELATETMGEGTVRHIYFTEYLVQ